MIHTEDIKDHARLLGIDDLRITTAEPFHEAIDHLRKQEAAGFFNSNRHYLASTYDVRTILPNAQSIIVACEFYLTDEREDLSASGDPHGRIARYTWRNYYRDLRTRLKELARAVSSSPYAVFSNGPVAEKPLAQRSGLGFYGKHSILLHPEYGSWIVLGEIITDIALEPSQPLPLDCNNCRQCMDACPTQAIKKPYVIDRTRCIDELKNWCGRIPEDIMAVWGNRLYGCTACQDACPLNQRVKPRPPHTETGLVGSSIPLFEILTMDENDYRKRFADNQISARWIHFKAIQRNALLALAHSNDATALPFIDRFRRSSDDMLRDAAQWAYSHLTNA